MLYVVVSPLKAATIRYMAERIRAAGLARSWIPHRWGIPDLQRVALEVLGFQCEGHHDLSWRGRRLAGLALPRVGRLVINLELPRPVQNFTRAHEVFHLLAHDSEAALRDLPGAADSEFLYDDPLLRQWENEANYFAAEWLLPDDQVLDDFVLRFGIVPPLTLDQIDDQLSAMVRASVDKSVLRHLELTKRDIAPSTLRSMSTIEFARLLANTRTGPSHKSLVELSGCSSSAVARRWAGLGHVRLDDCRRDPTLDWSTHSRIRKIREQAAQWMGNRGTASLVEGVQDIYITCLRQDGAEVAKISEWLLAKGVRHWLDAHDDRPGSRWSKRLEAALDCTPAVAICLGRGDHREWRALQLDEERSRLGHACRIIPVLLPSATNVEDVPENLLAYRPIDLRVSAFENAMDELLWGITGQRQAGLSADPPDPSRPFRRLSTGTPKRGKKRPRSGRREPAQRRIPGL